MKQLAILSGKGGTGKTSITACFAGLLKKSVIVDCDVDAPDLHMLLHPKILQSEQFQCSKIAEVDFAKCDKCGFCKKNCRFDAFTIAFQVKDLACEGCAVCALVCPNNAITLKDRISGNAYISEIEAGFMSHALLNPGEGNSGKLVTLVRQNAKSLAERENLEFILIDGPPGIACPTIATISGIDACLIVAEPTFSGFHDLKRILKLLKNFNIISFVCINMFDINRDNAKKITDFCHEKQIRVVGKLPFSSLVTQAMIKEKTIIEYSPNSKISKEIVSMWKKILKIMDSINK